jgi:hypothetical protein
MNRRTVVFLGAGASKPFGFPVTDSILPAIWTGLKDGTWREWPGVKNRKKQKQFATFLERLLTRLLPGLNSQAPQPGGASIVDVVSLLDQLLLENRSPHPDLSESDLQRGRSMLHLGINAVIRGRERETLRNRFVDWLLSEAVRHEGNRVSLVSTNYDTAVEQRLHNELISAKTSIGRQVDFGIPWRDAYRDLLHVRPQSAKLAVFKLHGSLNWLRCEVCGHVTINVRQRIASLEFWDRTSKYSECYCGGRLRSVIVTPSIVRDVRDGNLLSIWNAALEDLRRAHEWVFIGYSLPSEDIAIRSLLLRAFHARQKRRSLRIRVVQWEDPKCISGRAQSPEYARYRMFFPERHLNERDYSRAGLEPFVERLKPLSRSEMQKGIRISFPRMSRAWVTGPAG